MLGEKKLKDQLLSQVDSSNPIDLEKVDRYVSMVKVYHELQKTAIESPTITIDNGKQHFVKSNPALGDMNKINASLIALGKDMGLATSPGPGGKGDGYDSDDLL